MYRFEPVFPKGVPVIKAFESYPTTDKHTDIQTYITENITTPVTIAGV